MDAATNLDDICLRANALSRGCQCPGPYLNVNASIGLLCRYLTWLDSNGEYADLIDPNEAWALIDSILADSGV